MAIRAVALVAAAAATMAFTAARPEPPAVRTCAERAEVSGPDPVPAPTARDLFVGRRILLVGARRANFHTDAGDLWLKSLAMVRAGRDVTLRVPRFERGRLGLRYANLEAQVDTVERAQTAVRIRPCPARMHAWTLFPGGFIFKRPGCYALDVRIEGRRATRHRLALGRGARCPR